MTALRVPQSATAAGDALAVEHLLATAARLGITVLDAGAGGRPWPDERTVAIVCFGEQVALGPRLDDDGMRADVLSMALIVAAVMGDREAGHPCAITAPAGYVLIARTRVPWAAGPGKVATLLARACGRDFASAAFDYTAPRERGGPWEAWLTRERGWAGAAGRPVRLG